jgi:hypothetical protein
MTLSVKPGLKVDDAAMDAVTNACGELGTTANAPSTNTNNAQIVAGWGTDQYSNQDDPNAANKKYGLHVTVETFDSSRPEGQRRTGRWHVYESGAVYVDRNGTISYVCNS